MSAPARSEDWVLRFLRRGVVKRLNIALHDSKAALSCEWVNRDPDLKAVRDAPDADWRVLMDRYCGSTVSKDPDWKLVHERASALAAEMRSVHGQPDRPWGDPARRHYAWSALAFVLGVVVVVAVLAGATEQAGVLIALAALATMATVRAIVLARETWLIWRADPQSTRDAAGWTRRSVACSRIAFALGLASLISVGLEPRGVEWLVPFTGALGVALTLVWAIIAAKQAAWIAPAVPRGPHRRQDGGAQGPPAGRRPTPRHG